LRWRRVLRKALKRMGISWYKRYNPGSAVQNHRLFFHFLKILPLFRSRKTGEPTLNDDTLTYIVADRPSGRAAVIAEMLRSYRRAVKIKGYAKKLSSVVHPDGKVFGARTGRWSYEDPNMQNWPLEVRHMIRARPNMWLIGGDSSQLELRLMAYLAGQEDLIELFESGVDVHNETQRILLGNESFDVPPETLIKYRTFTKTFTYAVIYMGSAKTAHRQLVDKFPQLMLSDVIRFQKAFFNRWDRFKPYAYAQKKLADELGYLEVPISHRRYYFYGVPARITACANIRVQGTGAALINSAIERIDARKGGHFLFQVHDAIYLEGKDRVALARILKEEMERPVEIEGRMVSIPAEVKWGKNWRNMRKAKLL
jgi:DNA polymerase I